MKCTDNVKDLRRYIHITLNTGRSTEVEEFECLQVSGQAARFGLPAEPTSLHITNKTYPGYSRCWKCSVLSDEK